MLCNPKEDSHTRWTTQDNIKGRRELKGYRRPARVEQLTLFRESRPTQPTTATSLLSLLLSRFQIDVSEDVHSGLSIGRTRRHRPTIGQRAAPPPAAGILPPTAGHDTAAGRPRNSAEPRVLHLHTPLH